ncbi:intracellular proteinase inhibitor [Clostridium homopropionicum DSM 5847]|uniref:Intracellular proteinase inhibitor n=1 Tax=Clostridium homopropionicum DSM 5847 TaxID=1121318 RepID=A0A0L6Z5F2_9CLOT|nr:BsuPI-related putative proteinase inhibitor [Clostridium homopropionicum]KOA18189.1 intracellular proteinase inhibitor [Clostridium homopropionicum DSM 5847]SFF71601.1 Intracellular proteinase inhibitor [Clostridium homopropionicum]
MRMRKIATLMLALSLTLGVVGCASANSNISSGIGDEQKDSDLGIYKVTQQKDKDNLKITIVNPLKNKVTLTFGSTQEYEFLLFKDGKEVYKYSKDKSFAKMIVKKEVEAKGKLEYNINLSSLGLEEGNYQYEFYLVANELTNLAHKEGTLTIGKKSSNGTGGIAYFPLKYELQSIDNERLKVQVKNQNEKPVTLTYTSGQRFDIKFYKDGKLVYTWSQDKLFIQEVTEKTIIQGESEVYEVNLKDLPLEKGTYEYEFYSTAKELSKAPYLKGSLTIK